MRWIDESSVDNGFRHRLYDDQDLCLGVVYRSKGLEYYTGLVDGDVKYFTLFSEAVNWVEEKVLEALLTWMANRI